jgi:cell division protein FtsB
MRPPFTGAVVCDVDSSQVLLVIEVVVIIWYTELVVGAGLYCLDGSRKMKRKNQDQIIDFDEARAARKKKRELLAAKKAKTNEVQPVRKNGAKIFGKLYALAALIIVIAAGVFSLRIAALQMDLSKVKAENEAELIKIDRLQNELEHIDDAEYIEQQARSRLHMVKPGELLYVLPTETGEEAGDSEFADNNDDVENEDGAIEDEEQ